ncbi:MAG: ATP-binding protein [Candidatus Diapherotrites archaeon]|nr:ATP-binding protein [Candidatus Diapherotrites archaeon]
MQKLTSLPGEIGEVTSKVTGNDFTVKIHCDSKIKQNDFLKVHSEDCGWVLCQVKDITRTASSTLNSSDDVTCTAKIIGYRDERNLLKKPLVPFKPGSTTYKANRELIISILGLSKQKNDSLYIGLLEGHNDIQVFLEAEKLITKHFSILAMSGSGKSYLSGVILEEIMDKGIPIVVIDPHGEYTSLSMENNDKNENIQMKRYGVSRKAYKGIKEYCFSMGSGEQLNIDGKNLSSKEILDMLPIKMSNNQIGMLYEAINDLKKEPNDYSLNDVLKRIEENESSIKWSLIGAIQEIEDLGFFSTKPTPMEEIIKPKQMTVLNLKGERPQIQQIIAYKLLNQIFLLRKQGIIPPMLLVIEEAHNFCPERSFGEVCSSTIIRNIASEGRKFGLGLAVITQRPARIDKNVLSQCNSQFILKMRNPNDLKAVSQSLEGFSSDLMDRIKSLSVGNAILAGEIVEIPLTVNVRTRKTEHGGAAVKMLNMHFVPEKLQKPKKGGKQGDKTPSSKTISLINKETPKNYTKLKPFFKVELNEKIFLVDACSGELVFKEGKIKSSVVASLEKNSRTIFSLLIKNDGLSEKTLRLLAELEDKEFEDSIKELAEKNLISTEKIGDLEYYSPSAHMFSEFKTTKIKDEGQKESMEIKAVVTPKALENYLNELFDKGYRYSVCYYAE